MKFVISSLIIAYAFSASAAADDLRSSVLREAAIDAGFVPSSATRQKTNPDLVSLGHLAFESTQLSAGQDIACATCHRDLFGSADGISNAVGIGGDGAGDARVASGGRIVPRNTLPFWGVGGIGYDTFFWDGKVSGHGDDLVSQFGHLALSSDPLVVAAMVPPVEVDEMVGDIGHLTTETVESATVIYDQLVEQLATDPDISDAVLKAFGTPANDVKFENYAKAIAEFIRFNFAVQDTRFHEFVFGKGNLTEDELNGGLIFYGKGRCSMCHNGPYFSDFNFHSIPSPSGSFGKNGFGIDYGRFNVTNDPRDRGKFRTPPLYNVLRTAPYGHSGAYLELSDIILAHSDPLIVLNFQKLSSPQRQDIYQQLRLWVDEPVSQSAYTSKELSQLISFLATFELDAEREVISP
ncbi:His-Xaa-Ser system-associated MauG-like protein [Parasedimentitalea maritima]|uniref:Methylamine utilization protein MauG n=1 Tax=Parasedimentitalea maritima TaxID=2578117 RepID=A0A6A4R6U0_9RHOB|nr:His-Xaa-Ser system-associated MauG-like protein [Zongyanglinia marina]KAE9625949.1 methylamine utilization protein MauG [Zongyanglinia marina]